MNQSDPESSRLRAPARKRNAGHENTYIRPRHCGERLSQSRSVNRCPVRRRFPGFFHLRMVYIIAHGRWALRPWTSPSQIEDGRTDDENGCYTANEGARGGARVQTASP
jgi:hypothetical protein